MNYCWAVMFLGLWIQLVASTWESHSILRIVGGLTCAVALPVSVVLFGVRLAQASREADAALNSQEE